MATLMEFAAASLERDGGGRSSAIGAPPDVVSPPVLHWGSAGRKALDANGRRNVKVEHVSIFSRPVEMRD